MKKLKLFIEENKSILLILLLAFLIRLFFFFSYHSVWWDSAVYIGMGKYIFSLGKQGLWEPIRPIVWPIILGFFWKLKLDPIFFGRLLNLIMGLGIIYLTYYISKKIFNEETALIASILISFSSIFFFFNYRLYTEIPAVFFALLAFYFYFKKKYFFIGFFLALSFLTKFPAGMFLICFLFIILWKKQFRKIPFVFYGFLIPVIPYLILNQNLYSDLFFSFISASTVIKKTLSCTILMGYKWYSYFLFILKDNILNLFVIYGIYHTLKKHNKERILLLLLFFFPLIYFIQLACRQNYYIILFLPFLSILTAEGISKTIKKFDKKYFIKIIGLIILISFIFSLTHYFLKEQRKQIPEIENFYRFAENKSIIYEVWITNPIINLYLPKKAELLYYPVYDINTIFNFQQYLQSHNISYIFLDTCGGGMTCAPSDTACHEKTKEFIDFIPSYKFWLVYNETYGICNYYIFRK